MIVIVDYGVGNLSSIVNMLRKAGGDVAVSRDPATIIAADKLLLPGIGHFDHGMKMLNHWATRGLGSFCIGHTSSGPRHMLGRANYG